MTQEPTATDAIWTIPNALTFLRLGLTPIFLVLALTQDALGLAVVIGVIVMATDLLDGKIARKMGTISRLGIVLDPLADRLAIAATAIALIARDLAPIWLVALVVGRDVLLVLVGVPILKARGIPIPAVSKIGKIGSFATSSGLGILLGAAFVSVADPSRPVQIIAYVILAGGIPLYWAAGVGYITAGLKGLSSGSASSSR